MVYCVSGRAGSLGTHCVAVNIAYYCNMNFCVYRSCYLSEAPCFADSAHLAFDRLTRLHSDDIVGPSPPTPDRLVHQLIWEMDHLPLQLINQPPAVSNPKIYVNVLCRIYSKIWHC